MIPEFHILLNNISEVHQLLTELHHTHCYSFTTTVFLLSPIKRVTPNEVYSAGQETEYTLPILSGCHRASRDENELKVTGNCYR